MRHAQHWRTVPRSKLLMNLKWIEDSQIVLLSGYLLMLTKWIRLLASLRTRATWECHPKLSKDLRHSICHPICDYSMGFSILSSFSHNHQLTVAAYVQRVNPDALLPSKA